LDRDGILIGVIAPPCEDPSKTEEMTEEIKKLLPCGKKYADSKRGSFEILEHGIQMGSGHNVSIHFALL
jgi:hypothetical protein